VWFPGFSSPGEHLPIYPALAARGSVLRGAPTFSATSQVWLTRAGLVILGVGLVGLLLGTDARGFPTVGGLRFRSSPVFLLDWSDLLASHLSGADFPSLPQQYNTTSSLASRGGAPYAPSFNYGSPKHAAAWAALASPELVHMLLTVNQTANFFADQYGRPCQARTVMGSSLRLSHHTWR